MLKMIELMKNPEFLPSKDLEASVRKCFESKKVAFNSIVQKFRELNIGKAQVEKVIEECFNDEKFAV